LRVSCVAGRGKCRHALNPYLIETALIARRRDSAGGWASRSIPWLQLGVYTHCRADNVRQCQLAQCARDKPRLRMADEDEKEEGDRHKHNGSAGRDPNVER